MKCYIDWLLGITGFRDAGLHIVRMISSQLSLGTIRHALGLRNTEKESLHHSVMMRRDKMSSVKAAAVGQDISWMPARREYRRPGSNRVAQAATLSLEVRLPLSGLNQI